MLKCAALFVFCVLTYHFSVWMLTDKYYNCKLPFHVQIWYDVWEVMTMYVSYHKGYTDISFLMLWLNMLSKTTLFCCFVSTNCTWILHTLMNRLLSKMALFCCLIITQWTWIFLLFMGWLDMSISMCWPFKFFITFVAFVFHSFMNTVDMNY